MPRPNKRVKDKPALRGIESPGLIDLHFHGAFGIDLMTASPADLDELTRRLAEAGLAGFCPTTLSVEAPELLHSVRKLGTWIAQRHTQALDRTIHWKRRGAIPLGIHLEGPFISPKAAGAHPPGVIRPLSFDELEQLWEASQGTLKVLTVAPEAVPEPSWRRLAQWCENHGIHLSLGHTPSDQETAEAAFDAGFRGLTHAWNALSFHHRAPGALGAALGRKGLFLELIADGVHVHPTVVRWTHRLHAPEPICWISDGAPAAGLPPGEIVPFGPLAIENREGACRLTNGALAGGGLLLPQCVSRWVAQESPRTGRSPGAVLRQILPYVTQNPRRALRIAERSPLGRALRLHPLRWVPDSKGVLHPFPVDSVRGQRLMSDPSEQVL